MLRLPCFPSDSLSEAKAAQASLSRKESADSHPDLPYHLVGISLWWIGVPKSTEILAFSGRGLEASEGEAPVNLHPQQQCHLQ